MSQQARGYRSLLLSSLLVGTLAAPTGAQQPVTPVIGVSSPTIDFGQVAIGQPAYINDDLFNAVTDSTSILEVTDMSVVGEGFSIYSPPDSVDIPGDGTTVILPIRFRPTAQNPASGSIDRSLVWSQHRWPLEVAKQRRWPRKPPPEPHWWAPVD